MAGTIPRAAAPAGKRPTAIGYGYQRRALLRQLADEAGACLAQLATDREAGRSGAARNWA